MALSESTKRALRTAYHGLIAVVTGGPTIIPLIVGATKGTPYAEKAAALGAATLAWLAGVAIVVNKLEDAGVIPSPGRTVESTSVTVAPDGPDPAP